MSPRVSALALLVFFGGALTGATGCSGSAPKDTTTGPASPIHLAADLVSPTDIKLAWKDTEPEVAGRTVEFATEPNGQYTVLEFVPPGRATFEHRDLMPETTFYYRVRSLFGPASRPVEVTLPPGELDETSADDQDWAKPRAEHRAAVPVQTIRNIGTADAGAPTDLTPTIMDPNGIKFTWTDHSGDEEGYLLEVKPDGSPDYEVAAVLDPDITSVGMVTQPNEKKASYRVRAFYYGASSNVVHRKTGQDRSG
jgi:hypothetical protein